MDGLQENGAGQVVGVDGGAAVAAFEEILAAGELQPALDFFIQAVALQALGFEDGQDLGAKLFEPLRILVVRSLQGPVAESGSCDKQHQQRQTVKASHKMSPGVGNGQTDTMGGRRLQESTLFNISYNKRILKPN